MGRLQELQRRREARQHDSAKQAAAEAAAAHDDGVDPTLQHFVVISGRAVPMAPADLRGVHGKAPPPADAVVTMPNGERLCFYPANLVRPWRLSNDTVEDRPQAFTTQDFKNMFGPYLVWLGRKALTPEEETGWTRQEIVLLLVGLGALVAAGIAAFFAHHGDKILRGF